jgi:hypothetical protein
MAVIAARVEVDGEPLRRAYVEHIGLGSVGVQLTSQEGAFSFDGGFFDRIDVKVHCQNSVIRVVNGEVLNWGISIDKKVGHGDVIRIRNRDDFTILNSCLDVYDTVWRQFSPYTKAGRRAFAIKRQSKLNDTFASNRRLELSYPDHLSPDRSFVEPAGLTNAGLPLAHIKDKSRAGRLFGDKNKNGTRNDPSLLPHELGHVFHFAAMVPNMRNKIEVDYLAWLAGQIPSGDFGHDTTKRTIPMVAYVEAASIFSERFFFFRKRVEPSLTGNRLYKAFVEDELSEAPRLGDKLRATILDRDGNERKRYVQIARRNERGSIDPQVTTGNDVEGSVYGAIYLDLASEIGLKAVVEGVLASNASNFDEFATYMDTTQPMGRTISFIRQRWAM